MIKEYMQHGSVKRIIPLICSNLSRRISLEKIGVDNRGCVPRNTKPRLAYRNKTPRPG